jgi:hypothetical protein
MTVSVIDRSSDENVNIATIRLPSGRNEKWDDIESKILPSVTPHNFDEQLRIDREG